MAFLVSDVVQKAIDVLKDPNTSVSSPTTGAFWTANELLAYAQEGYLQIARFGKWFRKTAYLPLAGAPQAPTVTSNSVGGSIAGGSTVYVRTTYTVTNVNGGTDESGVSVEVTYQVPSGTNTNQLVISDSSLTLPFWAAGCNVYVSPSGGVSWSETLAGSMTYSPNGSLTINSLPATTNTKMPIFGTLALPTDLISAIDVVIGIYYITPMQGTWFDINFPNWRNISSYPEYWATDVAGFQKMTFYPWPSKGIVDQYVNATLVYQQEPTALTLGGTFSPMPDDIAIDIFYWVVHRALMKDVQQGTQQLAQWYAQQWGQRLQDLQTRAMRGWRQKFHTTKAWDL